MLQYTGMVYWYWYLLSKSCCLLSENEAKLLSCFHFIIESNVVFAIADQE